MEEDTRQKHETNRLICFMCLFAKFLPRDETTYLERFLYFLKHVSITRDFCVWNVADCLEFSTAIAPESA